MTYSDQTEIEAFRELDKQRRGHQCTTECEGE